eukprot:1633430-Pleurochrysis_carterae.AAC.1
MYALACAVLERTSLCESVRARAPVSERVCVRVRQVVMVTQASSDSSICLAVSEGDAAKAQKFLEASFEKELSRGLIAGAG